MEENREKQVHARPAGDAAATVHRRAQGWIYIMLRQPRCSLQPRRHITTTTARAVSQ